MTYGDEEFPPIEESLEVLRQYFDSENNEKPIASTAENHQTAENYSSVPQTATELERRQIDVVLSKPIDPAYKEQFGSDGKGVNPQQLFALIRYTQPILVTEKGVYDYVGGVYKLLDKRGQRAKIKDYVPVLIRNKLLIEDVVYELNSEPPDISEDEWDTDENIVNCLNGIYNIAQKTISSHSPEHLSRIQLPINYIPQRKLENAPTFAKMLKDYYGNDFITKDFVLDVMAVVLSNIRGSRLKGIIFLCGESNTGKSQVRQLLIHLIGKERSASIDIKRLNQQFGTSALEAARLAGHGDVPTLTEADFSNLKNLTGGDDSTLEYKYKNIGSLNFRGVFWFNANAMPPIKGDRSRAVYERLYIVPMNRVIPLEEQDNGFLDLLLAEKDVIASILMDRLKNIAERGYRVIPSETMLAARVAYEDSNNSLLGFVRECCILNDGKERCSRFHELYAKWCKLNRYRTEKLHDVRQILLKEYGIGDRKSNGYDWYDLSIRPEKSAEINNLYESYKSGR
jgi:putative DNA primase/helicase